MATTVILDEDFRVPLVGSLAEFRAWALSDSYPETGRIDYLGGRIEVDVSPEDLFTHGKLKTTLIAVLQQRIADGDLGDLFSDRTRVSCPEADLSVEPDLVFVSYDAVESGRVRLVPKASGERDRYVELEGAADLVVEIVSDRSVERHGTTARGLLAGADRGILAGRRAGVCAWSSKSAIGPRRATNWLPPAPTAQRSAIFPTWFSITRRRNRAGRWSYDVATRT